MRKTLRTAGIVAALALTLAGCVARESASDEPRGSDFTPNSQQTTEAGESCQYEAEEGAEPKVGLPPEDEEVSATTLSLTTSAGPMAIQLDAEQAPCTVGSMVFLAGEGYFDNTICHRLTTAEGLKVLQCGDPEGTGGGGPGYVVPDELPTDLAEGPQASNGQETVIYPRGVVAMANAGPNTTGSQFFLVYEDTTLPPSYTVIGTLDEAGLATLDGIAAAGVGAGGQSEQDGPPATEVTIQTAQAA